MLLNDEPFFESCLIKTDMPKKISTALPPLQSNHIIPTPIVSSINDDTHETLNGNNNITSEIVNDETYDSEDFDNEERPPLTFGTEIRPQNVRFKECDVNGLEEIDIDLEDKPIIEKEHANELKEVDLLTNFDSLAKDSNSITLKKPNQVYYEIYKQALKKARQSKKEAILAFLEAKNIKKTYMLEDLSDDDSDDESIHLDTLEDL
jgi:hypothetical protein